MPEPQWLTIDPEMCVAMHCPQYMHEHDIGTDGCLYDAHGEERHG